jgi:coenzyme F420-reducing hydrogenase gamma subunit
MNRPTIAIAGLTACSGCQLTFLNCEVELPEVAKRFTIRYFPMGLTERAITGPIDVAFVEGAVSTPDDLETLMKLRSCSRLLVAFGTCALWTWKPLILSRFIAWSRSTSPLRAAHPKRANF